MLIPFSSWAVYFGSIFFSQDSVQALGCSTWLEAYVKAIPFCIYPIVTLIILFLFSFGFFPKLGKMKEAYERVEKTGMVYGESSRKYNLNEESGEDGNIWDFIVPMAVLVIVAVATGNLVVAQVVTFLQPVFICKRFNFSEYRDCFLNGFSDMLPIVTLIILPLLSADCF